MNLQRHTLLFKPIDGIWNAFSTFTSPSSHSRLTSSLPWQNVEFFLLLDSSFNYTLTEGKNVNKTEQKETNDKKRNIAGYSLSTFIQQIFSHVCVFFAACLNFFVSEKKGYICKVEKKYITCFICIYNTLVNTWCSNKKRGWNEVFQQIFGPKIHNEDRVKVHTTYTSIINY